MPFHFSVIVGLPCRHIYTNIVIKDTQVENTARHT
nr:MAG TPA: hypothetical protein [Caudoviricetes sp.]